MFNFFRKKPLKTIDKNTIEKEIEQFSENGTGEGDVIISLTSFPQRIYEIHYTLYSLLTQTVKPQKVILWLAKEQFPNLEKDIPEKVLKLKENGLSIEWCEDLRSYKKLIPTLQKYPNKTIVTADDDIFYERNWLEILMNSHNQNPDEIIAHRAHRIKLNKNGIAPYKKWRKRINGTKASYLNFLTGAGGVLYPANCFHKDICNVGMFKELAPQADDVWFWAMAVLNRTKTFVPKEHIKELTYINPERERGLTNEITLFTLNKKGGNDLQIEKIINHYPQILEILRK